MGADAHTGGASLAREPSDMSVLIVGAGPTGLTLACELRRRAVACRVIDRRAVHLDRSRAADVQPGSLEVFRRLGVAGDILARGRKLEAMTIYEGSRRLARLGFARPGAHFPFSVALPQGDTEAILERRLGELGGHVDRGVRLDSLTAIDRAPIAVLREPDGTVTTESFQWVVGCDGAASTVREQMGMEFEGRGEDRGFVAADVTLDWALPPNEISLFMSDTGYLLLLPLPAPRRVRMIADTNRLADRPTDLHSLAALAETYLGAPVSLQDTGLVGTYHVQRRLARGYRRGRVLLAGDAAHTFNPVGGHGMNQGVQDAHNLAWKLALVLRGCASESLIDTYETERRNTARLFTRELDFSARLALSQLDMAPEDADRLLDFAVAAPPLRRSVLDAALSPRWSYHSGHFVQDVVASGFEAANGVGAGKLAPDLACGDGFLSDFLRGPNHSLLLFGGASSENRARPLARSVLDAANEVHRNWSHVVDVSLVAAGETQTHGWHGPVVPDRNGAIHERYGATLPCGYLVRPDGHVGFRCLPLAHTTLNDHLRTLFSSRA
jgi:2-polyprenyl-6-methoxyphenol hydroxylase-like FAD-dependent oxidoreductase